jgi:CheY-like chemotaxis protein
LHVRQRILIVDDDARQRAWLKALLAHRNFYVELAVDGLDAVQRARLGWFDVILMNTDIPEVDGIAAARLITKLTQDHGSPRIIALSADPAALLQRRSGAGQAFFSMLPRPCDEPGVLEAVGRAIDADTGLLPDVAQVWSEAAGRRPCYGRGAVWPMRCANEVPARFRVLLVDDDDFPREVLCDLLSVRGYAVEPARDGLEAVLMMGESAYDAAVLDYDLPRVNGMAAARLVHDLLSRTERPSLIALTAHPGAVADRQRSSLPLFDHIIGKFTGFQPVIGALEKCLAARQASWREAGRLAV